MSSGRLLTARNMMMAHLLHRHGSLTNQRDRPLTVGTVLLLEGAGSTRPHDLRRCLWELHVTGHRQEGHRQRTVRVVMVLA